MSRYFKAQIAENRALNEEHNLLTLIPLSPIKEPKPGQFYMIGVDGDYDPLLKRPFSLLRKKDGGLQILYRIRGRGTALLRNTREGTVVDVLGPLGNSYPLPTEDQTPLIVAGGLGIASLFSLIEKIGASAHLFYGAKNSDELFMMDELHTLSKGLHISTDDGSYGKKGWVVETFGDFLNRRETPGANYLLYACGPRPMLEAVLRLVEDKGIPSYVSMEENMACGIGACLGCVVRTVDGNKRVCKEGPVFRMDEIVW